MQSQIMSSRGILFLIAGLIFAVPLGLEAAYIWQAGLDLRSPSDAREWISLCARGREDLYCKAARRVTKDVEGPIIFLHPNQGDDETTRDILKWTGEKVNHETVDELARANLFQGSTLSHGTLKSLDGQIRTVNCIIPGRKDACEIDGISIYLRNDPNNMSDGAIYSTSRPPNEEGYDFLLPLE